MMKKVLIIAFYWPPSGGSSVQRWLHFANYLPDHGWEPIVYVPENAQYPETDPTLESRIRPGTRVIRRKITEPYGLYRKFSGVGRDKNLAAGMTLNSRPTGMAGLKNKLSVFIRGNFFIPDARMLWIKPSVNYLSRFLINEQVEAIITTGPPHSLHLIGYHLHDRTGIPWVADFRDPWTRIDFYSELRLTKLADRYHHYLEEKVLRGANRVIAIGKDMQQEFLSKGARRVEVITNGYDEGDLPEGQVVPDQKFSLLHVGTFSRSRNSQALWKVLGEMAGKDATFAADLVIRLIGNVDYSILQSIEDNGLKSNLEHIPYLVHAEAMKEEARSQVLLLMINNSENSKGILTGKFFEYLASHRPILLIGPTDGDAAGILEETGSGLAAGFADENEIRRIIKEYYARYRSGNLISEAKETEKYSRKGLTWKLAVLLDDLAGKM